MWGMQVTPGLVPGLTMLKINEQINALQRSMFKFHFNLALYQYVSHLSCRTEHTTGEWHQNTFASKTVYTLCMHTI